MSLIEMSINGAAEPSVPSTAGLSARNAAALSDTGVLQAMKGEGIARNAAFSEEEFERLSALRFGGYEDMTVAKYREKAVEGE